MTSIYERLDPLLLVSAQYIDDYKHTDPVYMKRLFLLPFYAKVMAGSDTKLLTETATLIQKVGKAISSKKISYFQAMKAIYSEISDMDLENEKTIELLNETITYWCFGNRLFEAKALNNKLKEQAKLVEMNYAKRMLEKTRLQSEGQKALPEKSVIPKDKMRYIKRQIRDMAKDADTL